MNSKFPRKKTSPDAFAADFYQTFKEEIKFYMIFSKNNPP